MSIEEDAERHTRITSYNVCYTKLLRMITFADSVTPPGPVAAASRHRNSAIIVGLKGNQLTVSGLRATPVLDSTDDPEGRPRAPQGKRNWPVHHFAISDLSRLAA